MGRYNFLSPGAAAGDALVDTLVARRDEERQRLLDEVTMREREEQLEWNKQRRLASEQELFNTDIVNVMANRPVGSDLSDLDPKILGELKRRGVVGSKPGATVEASATFAHPDGMGDFVTQPDETALPGAFSADNTPFQVPQTSKGGSNIFLGNKEDQDKERRRAALGKVLSDPNLKNMTTAQRAMAVAQAMEDDSLPAGFWNSLEDPQGMFILNEADGSMSPAMANGRQVTTTGANPVVTRRRPPQPRQGPEPKLFTNKDGKSIWLKPGEAVPEGFRQGNQPTTRTAGAAGVGMGPDGKPILTDVTMRRMAELRGGNRTQQAQADEMAVNAIQQANVSHPSVREAAMRVFEGFHPITGEPLEEDENGLEPSAEDLYQELLTIEGVTPQEAQEFMYLVRMTRGN